jgi:molybdopterin-guanine dinucleotide biosynthesis protein A
MGSPKQMIAFGERTLGEIAADALTSGLGGVCCVALGAGALPARLGEIRQLPDSPGFAGPGAALIAAHRWAPEAAWIVAACDHPWVRGEHIAWLAQQRQAGRWAVIPRQLDGHTCQTLALYEPQALEVLERVASADAERNVRPAKLLKSPHTLVLELPAEFADGWKNVNTREELRLEAEQLGLGAEKVGE